MIETTVNLAPMIKQTFNPYLFMERLERIFWDLEKKIKPSAKKKIRLRDVGKRREFDKLIMEFAEVYERKKIEKEKYDRKIKEFAQKRPCISASGSTMRFERIQS